MPKVPKVTSLQILGKKEVRDQFIFLHEDKHQSFLEADTIVFGGHSQHAQSTQNKSLQYLRNISRKKGGMKLIFHMQITKLPYKLILSILVSMTSHVPSYQNNKFAKFFQFLKKEVRDEVDFVQINIKVFKKLVLTYLMGTARHV